MRSTTRKRFVMLPVRDGLALSALFVVGLLATAAFGAVRPGAPMASTVQTAPAVRTLDPATPRERRAPEPVRPTGETPLAVAI